MGERYVPIYRVALVREGRQQANCVQIEKCEDAAQLCLDYFRELDREVFIVMGLSTKQRVLGLHTVSIGTLNSTLVHPREVFKPMILMNAAMVIIAHNHPSGDPSPSPEDREMTQRIVEAGRLLGIDVLDHIIVGEESFTSCRRLGWI